MVAYTRMGEKCKQRKALSLKAVGWIIAAISFVISASLIASLFDLSNRYNRLRTSTAEYMSWKTTALDVELASDYLTEQVRSFVITRDDQNIDNYFFEIKVTKRRDHAIERFKENLEGTTVYGNLNIAVSESIHLMDSEYYAMRLVIEGEHSTLTNYPEEIRNVVLQDEDLALDDDAKFARATDIVFGENYNFKKDVILNNVNLAISTLDYMLESNVTKSAENLKRILIIQQGLIAINIIFLASVIVLMHVYLIKPVNGAARHISNGEEIPVRGIREYRLIAETYNVILKQNNNIKEELEFEATHDKTTGLLNRSGYDAVYKKVQLSKAAFILCDIDEFKGFNDKYGHEMGDKVLIKVADKIKSTFNDDNSHVFRIGGDEFAIIYENVEENFIYELLSRFNKMNEKLKHRNGIVPPIALSGGIAKGDEMDTTDTLFRKADIALYFVKKHGRGKIEIYNIDMKRE